MHTSFQLQSELFKIRIDGRSADLADLFPDWTGHDRVGVISNSPFAPLGASVLIQAAVTQFFNHRRENIAHFTKLLDREGEREVLERTLKRAELTGRRNDPAAAATKAKIAFGAYAEIYVLHIDKRTGDHSSLDVFPANREVTVPKDFIAVITQLADLGITRLLLPEGPSGDATLDWEIRAALRDRIQDVFVYHPEGRVSDFNIEISATSPVVEENPEAVLSAREVIAAIETNFGPNFSERTRNALALMRSRINEVSEDVVRGVKERREARLVDGMPSESYRRIGLEEGLQVLSGITGR
ncbi:hypothetical protein [Arthrobacter sp. Cr_A7]|uniref:hypothetical protein n=1 Tax=Arthrobacter sp. Cr_A7 TaxID=3031017 RepID=UPI0023DC089D|nr:hypothetical protein [Arthrobacter sp. Cr_A7]MDF2049575.1 hypothetical protein [Arthrobacter sp. Cr_A7]